VIVKPLRDWHALMAREQTPAAPISEETIKRMADRFLGWQLPSDFKPDAGIRFTRQWNMYGGGAHRKPSSPRPMPFGTNLFDATQAIAMVRHMVDGLALPHAAEIEKLRKQLVTANDRFVEYLAESVNEVKATKGQREIFKASLRFAISFARRKMAQTDETDQAFAKLAEHKGRVLRGTSYHPDNRSGSTSDDTDLTDEIRKD
jgi:hypothetical protein